MRYWLKRLRLLWKFVALIPRAREIEVECQKIQQKMHDLEFSNALSRNDKEKELAYQKGYWEGILWAANRFTKTSLIIICIAASCIAEKTKTVYNATTGKLDYITKLDSSTLPGGSTNYIQARSDLQSGATFYVSSATVQGRLTGYSGISITNAPTPGTTGTASLLSTGDPSTKGLLIRGGSANPNAAAPNSVSGLTFWLKGNTGVVNSSGVVANDGDFLGTWQDQSGNAYNLSEILIESRMPTYRANVVNALPVIRYDGGDTLFSGSVNLPNQNQGRTIIMVLKITTTANAMPFAQTTSTDQFGWNITSGNLLRIYANAYLSTGYTMTTGTWYVLSLVFNNGTAIPYVNGVAKTSASSINLTKTGNSTIAVGALDSSANLGFNGDIAEFLYYNTALTEFNISAIEQNLGAKYNISVTVHGGTAQFTNLQEWQSSTGVAVSSVTSSGAVYAPSYGFNMTVDTMTAPSAPWLLGIDSAGNLVISTGTAAAAWVKVGSQ